MFKGCGFATLILHIRRWMALLRFASHAIGCRVITDRAREFEVVDRPSSERYNSRHPFDGSRNPSNRRLTDSDCGHFSVALIELGKMLMLPGDRWVWLLLGTAGAALAMLGPGLFSIDARLFGWKRIEAPLRKSSSSSS